MVKLLFYAVGLGYCFTPYQRLWLYNGAPLVAFYDTLGIRRTYSRLKPPASSREGGGVNWLFNVTINDILVIYVIRRRCAGRLQKLDLRSGSKRNRHFVGFSNVPVQAPTWGQPFYTVIPRNRPI